MLQLVDIRKAYTTGDFTQVALDGVSVTFRDNEFAAILGPSGSGKTTMLNILGGLDRYDSGDLIIDGVSTKEYKNKDWDAYRNHRVGFVFQSYNLIPHQSILSNVELALTLSGVPSAERKQRAKEALEKVGLGEHAHKRPNQLSGGQMQRVSIARALINNPDIVLADEPTGALDTKTSVQIMDLLSEIAKDRLVIMVTHNPELADEYATRTVQVRDGQITDDSNPFNPDKDAVAPITEEKSGKTKMSFFTAVALSFNNLMTKKGRTFMTAFAGSIGIIGIAAILALSNGVNAYIENVEQDTMSGYPITIQNSSMDMSSMMVSLMGGDNPDGNKAEEGTIGESTVITDMFAQIGTNDLGAFKSYIEGPGSDINQYASSISYDYSIKPYVYSTNTDSGVKQLNPSTIFSSMYSMSSALAGSSMMDTDIFAEMHSTPEVLSKQYDMKVGTWPQNYDECILVLNSSGQLSDYASYALGYRDPEELTNMVTKAMEGEEVNVDITPMTWTYDDFMNLTFKVLSPADTYRHNDEYNVWENMSDDDEYMKQALADHGVTLKIVGIVQPTEGSTTTALSSGIYYTADLTKHMIDYSATTPIVQSQLADSAVNVISGKSFDQEEQDAKNGEALDFSNMFSVDEQAMSNAFKMDMDEQQIASIISSYMASSAPDMSSLMGSMDTSALTNAMNSPAAQPQVDTTAMSQAMGSMMATAFGDFLAQADPSHMTNPALLQADMQAFMQSYFSTPAGQAQVQQLMASMAAAYDTSGTAAQMSAAMAQMQQQMSATMQSAMQAYVTTAMTGAMTEVMNQMGSSMSVDGDAIANAFSFNMTEDDLMKLMEAYMGGDAAATYESNLREMGYADLAKPTGISIYPVDFAAKDGLIGVIDRYNNEMTMQDKDDSVITYSDIMGMLLSSVTNIVNMISYMLIAFVSISLVVSSIMIGIITYISVLERRKEIGVLRSIGASKGDVSNVFNAETLIIGFVAGLLGIVITYLGCIPANIIVEQITQVPNIAQLPPLAALILVLISMFLTFIAGLIPSSKAARSDPAEALRAE